jgi:DNA-binding transcriptional ArsR family regulator
MIESREIQPAHPTCDNEEVTKRTEPVEALQLGPQDLPELMQERQIDDAKTIKVLSDPLRLRIMRVLSEGVRTEPRVWSVKQIAEEVGEQPSKLYWHVKQLLAVGLIQVAEIGLVGGIVEQRYRVAQTGLQVKVQVLVDHPDTRDDALTLADVAVDEFFRDMTTALDAGRAHLSAEESLAHPPHVRTVGTIADHRLPQAKAAEFARRLHELIHEFNTYDYDDDGVQVNLLTVFYATE